MSAPLRLAVNGKFLAAPPTGVHRVAGELTRALAALADRSNGAVDVELWIPANATQGAAELPVAQRVIGPLTGIPWEQLRLPVHLSDRTLLNLCNIGPVLRPNCVTMVHDAQVHLTPASYSLPFRYWYKLVQPLGGRMHRGLLTVSDYSRGQIARAGICAEDRIAVVHNGVDHMLRIVAEPGPVVGPGLAGRPYVVALATTQAHKNIGLLARAFADPALADVTLVLVGSGTRDSFAAAGIDLPPNALLTGRVSDGALRSLYEGALCIGFPSLTEGFGLPPLEAMLLGCPAVVAPCGALPEACGDAALYADAHDPRAWAQAIAALRDDPLLRRRYAELGRARAQRFTWAAAADRLVDAVRHMVPGRQTGPQPSFAGPLE